MFTGLLVLVLSCGKDKVEVSDGEVKSKKIFHPKDTLIVDPVIRRNL